MANSVFSSLVVSKVDHLTPDSVAISFDIPDDLKEQFDFVPGQYLTLKKHIDEIEVRRSYSICSALGENHLTVGVKHVKGGALSSVLQKALVGERIDVMAPQGQFTAPIGGHHNYLLIAAGSGITPCLSIATSVLENEADSTITLIYGNRSTGTIMFRKEIDALKDRYPDRFQLIHVLSRERGDIELLNGRVNGERLSALIDHHLVKISNFDAAYLCGPQQMITDCRSVLKDAGMDETDIHFELFFADSAAPKHVVSSDETIEDGNTVGIILDGSEREIIMDPTRETVLSAAQRNGLDLPFSCAGGMCCTCRCKVVDGQADMDANYSLQKWEVEQGFVLACQARPTSEKLTLDFDAS